MNELEQKLIEFLKQGIEPDLNLMVEKIRASFTFQEIQKMSGYTVHGDDFDYSADDYKYIRSIISKNNLNSAYGCAAIPFSVAFFEIFLDEVEKTYGLSKVEELKQKLKLENHYDEELELDKGTFYENTLFYFFFQQDSRKIQRCIESAKEAGFSEDDINEILKTCANTKRVVDFLEQGIEPNYNSMIEKINSSFETFPALHQMTSDLMKDKNLLSEYEAFHSAFVCVGYEKEYKSIMLENPNVHELERINSMLTNSKYSFYDKILNYFSQRSPEKFQECIFHAREAGLSEEDINEIINEIKSKPISQQNDDENSLESRLVKVLKRGVGTDFNSMTEIMKNEFQPDEIKKIVETDTVFNDAALDEEYSCIHPVLLKLSAENEAKNNTNGSSIESDLYGDVWQEQSAMQSKMRMIDFYNNTLKHFIGANVSDKIQECIENAKKDGLSEKQVNAILSSNGYDLNKHKQDETEAKLDNIISLMQGLKGKNATQEEIAKIIAESTKNLVGENSDDKSSDEIKLDEPKNIVKSTDENESQKVEPVNTTKSFELKDVKWDDVCNLALIGVQQYFCERQFDNSYTIKKCVEGGVGQFIEYGKTPNGDIILLPSPSFYTGKKPLLDTGVSVFSLLFGKDGYDDAHQLDTIHPAIIKPLNGEKVSIKDALVAMGSAKTVLKEKTPNEKAPKENDKPLDEIKKDEPEKNVKNEKQTNASDSSRDETSIDQMMKKYLDLPVSIDSVFDKDSNVMNNLERMFKMHEIPAKSLPEMCALIQDLCNSGGGASLDNVYDFFDKKFGTLKIGTMGSLRCIAIKNACKYAKSLDNEDGKRDMEAASLYYNTTLLYYSNAFHKACKTNSGKWAVDNSDKLSYIIAGCVYTGSNVAQIEKILEKNLLFDLPTNVKRMFTVDKLLEKYDSNALAIVEEQRNKSTEGSFFDDHDEEIKSSDESSKSSKGAAETFEKEGDKTIEDDSFDFDDNSLKKAFDIIKGRKKTENEKDSDSSSKSDDSSVIVGDEGEIQEKRPATPTEKFGLFSRIKKVASSIWNGREQVEAESEKEKGGK